MIAAALPMRIDPAALRHAVTPRKIAASLGARRRFAGTAAIVCCALLALIGLVLSLMLGPLAISASEVVAILLKSAGWGDAAGISAVKIGVVENIRAPRALLGLLAGAALGASGAAMQAFFRNPLADPGLVGVSAGAALAAVAVIVAGGAILQPFLRTAGEFALPLAAFAGALISVGLIYRIASLDGRVIVATMLLAGVACNAMASAGIGYLTFLADDTQLRDLTFWTLGSLGGAVWERVVPAALLMSIAIFGLVSLWRPMNGLLLGENDAVAMGVDVEGTKRRAALLTALGVGAATAVCGVIGFIGLVVPHLVRLVTGPDHRYVLPASSLLGGALVLLADLCARTLVAPAELPLGVLTALIGAPVFFWLLLKDKRRGRYG